MVTMSEETINVLAASWSGEWKHYKFNPDRSSFTTLRVIREEGQETVNSVKSQTNRLYVLHLAQTPNTIMDTSTTVLVIRTTVCLCTKSKCSQTGFFCDCLSPFVFWCRARGRLKNNFYMKNNTFRGLCSLSRGTVYELRLCFSFNFFLSSFRWLICYSLTSFTRWPRGTACPW